MLCIVLIEILTAGLVCLFVCNRGDTYYNIMAGSRQGSLAKTLSAITSAPSSEAGIIISPAISIELWSAYFDLKTYTVLTQRNPLLLAKSALSCWMIQKLELLFL